MLLCKEPTEVEPISDKLNVLMSEVQKQSDFVVGLSHSPPEVNRKLAREYPSFSAILSPYEGETEKIGDVLLAYCNSKGKTLGALMLTDGEVDISSKVQQIALTEHVSDDRDVRKLLDDFYHQVAIAPQFERCKHRQFLPMLSITSLQRLYRCRKPQTL